jgi:hypothetical protein
MISARDRNINFGEHDRPQRAQIGEEFRDFVNQRSSLPAPSGRGQHS